MSQHDLIEKIKTNINMIPEQFDIVVNIFIIKEEKRKNKKQRIWEAQNNKMQKRFNDFK